MTFTTTENTNKATILSAIDGTQQIVDYTAGNGGVEIINNAASSTTEFSLTGGTVLILERLYDADTLIGAAGADSLVGGAGDDVFGFAATTDLFDSNAIVDAKIDGGDGTGDIF